MKRPHISLNFAISADGKITTKSGDPSGWTSDRDTVRYFQIREKADAIMVGRGTQEADDMSLTNPGGLTQPARIVVSHGGNYDLSSKFLTAQGGQRYLIVTDRDADLGHLDSCDAIVLQMDLLTALDRLHGDGVRQLLCEGGGQLVKSLAALGVIDTIHLTWAAHTLIGGSEAPGIAGLPGDFFPTSQQFKLSHFEPSADDKECYLTYTRHT